MNEKLKEIDVCSMIENALSLSSVEMQINELEGILNNFSDGFLDINIFKIYRNEGLIFSNYRQKDPILNFFFQDYVTLTDEMVDSDFRVVVDRAITYFTTNFKEQTANKRLYLLYAVVCNELFRLKKQKKGTWNGRESIQIQTTDVCGREQLVETQITQEQEKKAIELFKKYELYQLKDFKQGILFEMIGKRDFIELYKRPNVNRTAMLVVELSNIFGEQWGEEAASKMTKGKYGLEDLRKRRAEKVEFRNPKEK